MPPISPSSSSSSSSPSAAVDGASSDGASSLGSGNNSAGQCVSTASAVRSALGTADWASPLVRVQLVVIACQGDIYHLRSDDGEVFAAKVFKRLDQLVHDRAFHERLTALGINHPSFPVYYGVKDVKGELALVTEFIHGADWADLGGVLHTHMKQLPLDANVAVAAVVSLAKDLFAGLAVLERVALSHGDIKPANLMLTGEGKLKIVDFGYWGSTNFPTLNCGTPGHLPPERFPKSGGLDVVDRSKSDCFGAANTVLGLLSACKISQDFEDLVPFAFIPSASKVYNYSKNFYESGLTAANFSQSKQPEAVLGACGTFFRAPTPNAMAVLMRANLSEHLFATRKNPPSAAAVQGYSQALKSLQSIPPEAHQRPTLAEELRALLSACIRSDWEDRPSAATMCERLQALELRLVPANDLEKVPEFLKSMVKKTLLEKSKPAAPQPVLAPAGDALNLPPAPPLPSTTRWMSAERKAQLRNERLT